MSGKTPITPKIAERLLVWILKEDLAEEVLGDLEEKFYSQASKSNTIRAKWNYWFQVWNYLRPFAMKSFFTIHSTSGVMIKNHLKIAFRNARKNASYSGLNLFGLTLGFTASMLIFFWVHHEYSVDRFHDNSENIYRVWRNMHQSDGSVMTTTYTPHPLYDVLKNEYPEVEHIAALSWNMDLLVEQGEVIGNEEGMFASEEFFEVFDYPIIAGSQTVLANPSQVALGNKVARKYFTIEADDFNAIIGQPITIDEEETYYVGAVFQSPDHLSSMQFDWLLPMKALVNSSPWMKDWGSGSNRFFLALNPGTSQLVAQRIEQEINDHVKEEIDERLILQSINDQYLYSKFENGEVVGGKITYVKILTTAAIFLFFVVCLNAMNLITAQSSKRTLEIGVRKVLGESKSSIRLQLLMESLMFATIATVLALGITWVLLPYFAALTNTPMSIADLGANIGLYALGLVAVSGLLMGLYPSVLLPTIKIIYALKGKAAKSLTAGSYRKSLIVFQFSISILIVFATVIIDDQVTFILNKDLGVDTENIVLVELEGELGNKYDAYRNELLQISEVAAVTGATGNPISYGRSTGSAKWRGKDPNDNLDIGIINVNDEFIETMGIELLKGRSLNGQFGADTANYMINEEAAKIMGFDDPVNERLSIWGIEGNIVGLVKDFHMKDLYEPIAPLVIRYDPNDMEVALIRIAGNTKSALSKIESLSSEMNPKYPLEYEFLDKSYAAKYENEVVVGQIIKLFAIISVLVSCIGLFTLATYSTYLRTKEIGIRKVYGAGVGQLVMLLSKEYSILILISIVLALPVTIIYGQQWLEQFQYRIELSEWKLFLGAFLGLAAGLFTVGAKTYQAAVANPSKSLRDE